jgi:holliday junction DNA helicase RuvA
MYDYIKGTLTDLSPSQAILESNGIGYSLFIPVNNFPELCGCKGKEICLFVAFVIREDSHRLFGFIHKNEREVFEKLSEVSGIGPKTALSIIGHLSLKELELALYEQDVLTLSKVPGIGKKTAERLIVDMKDKIKYFKPSSPTEEGLSKEALALMNDAVSALTNLGYHPSAAQPAVKKALKESQKALPLSELITLSLKAMRTK